MALNQIARVRGVLKCYCRYECRKCGGTQAGESFEVQIYTHDATSILGPSSTTGSLSAWSAWACPSRSRASTTRAQWLRMSS